MLLLGFRVQGLGFPRCGLLLGLTKALGHVIISVLCQPYCNLCLHMARRWVHSPGAVTSLATWQSNTVSSLPRMQCLLQQGHNCSSCLELSLKTSAHIEEALQYYCRHAALAFGAWTISTADYFCQNSLFHNTHRTSAFEDQHACILICTYLLQRK